MLISLSQIHIAFFPVFKNDTATGWFAWGRSHVLGTVHYACTKNIAQNSRKPFHSPFPCERVCLHTSGKSPSLFTGLVCCIFPKACAKRHGSGVASGLWGHWWYGREEAGSKKRFQNGLNVGDLKWQKRTLCVAKNVIWKKWHNAWVVDSILNLFFHTSLLCHRFTLSTAWLQVSFDRRRVGGPDALFMNSHASQRVASAKLIVNWFLIRAPWCRTRFPVPVASFIRVAEDSLCLIWGPIPTRSGCYIRDGWWHVKLIKLCFFFPPSR